MKTGMLVLALTIAGVLGGMCGALLVQGMSPAPAPVGAPADASPASRPPDEAREKTLADLRGRIEVLEANLGNVAAESGRIRDELAAERKAGGEAREKLATLEKDSAAAVHGAPDAISFGSRSVELGQAMPMLAGSGPMGERFRKTGELRALSVEDRWQKAREALGLTAYQEEELKAALKERDEANRDAMKVTTSEVKGADGSSNQSLSFAIPDMEKIRESRKRYDDRVNQSLNAEQAKKWKDDGFEGALGAGPGGLFATAIRVDAAPAETK